jgi:SOUL heme-binding protein
MRFRFVLIFVAFLQTGCSVFGVRSEENPQYRLITKENHIEVREYAPYIVATTTVAGSFRESQNKAFRILANYIFGGNEKQEKIAMTAPVIQSQGESKSEKIAMTAPVVQAPTQDGWQMTFMMPSKYTLETLPVPKDSRVELRQVPSKTVAVIRFSGLWSEKKNNQKSNELKSWVEKQRTYQIVSEPMFAGYDPPWTIPFLRRNEMMIEVRPL